MCELVLSNELLNWKKQRCCCEEKCKCKVYSLSQIHSFVLNALGAKKWPNHAYHKAQYDVMALRHIIDYLWVSNKFSGTGCAFYETPFVNSKNNQITPAIELQLLANGVCETDTLINQTKEGKNLNYLRCIGFSLAESENISTAITMFNQAK